MQLRANQQSVYALLGGLLALLSLSLWGGVVALDGQLILGFTVTLVTIFGFSLITWWLMFSPIQNVKAVTPRRLASSTRQTLALLVAGSAALLTLGLTWDEVWHRAYGVPLGEDFFWRPHILMYVSFGLIAAFAFGGLTVINRNPGIFRQKFRAEPLLGLLVLLSGFTLVSLPVDPLWHRIYGVDLTAWSMPHLVMFGAAGLIFVIGAAMQSSVIPRTGWRLGFGLRELVAAFMLAQSMLILITLLVVEWDGPRVALGQMQSAFYDRPQWLFPALIVGLMTLFGLLSLKLFQRVGAATLCGVLMLVSRWFMIEMFGASDIGMTIRPQIIALIPLIVLDVVYFVRRQEADSVMTARIAACLASVIGLAVTVFIISQWYGFPLVTPSFVLQVAVFGLPLTLLMAWYGYEIGQGLSRLRGDDGVTVTESRLILLRGAAGVAVMLLLTAWFVMTATSPVA